MHIYVTFITLRLKNILEPKLKETGTYDIFKDIEMPLIYVLAYMEREGVKIDNDNLKEYSKDLTQKIKNLVGLLQRLPFLFTTS